MKTGSLTLVAAVAATAACAYYNGLWRAHRFADEARRAEADGRTGEARSYWAQAAVRAESVVVRHPGSKWVDDALLLRGRALRELVMCSQALGPLDRVVAESPDLELREHAGILAGECRVQVGEVAAARATLTPIVTSSDSARRSQARYWRGVALQRQRDFGAALADFRASQEPRARLEETVTLVALGNVDAARPRLDSLTATGLGEADWMHLLEHWSAADPAEAGRLLERLPVLDARLSTGARARLAAAEGDRAALRSDTAAAIALYRTARVTAPDSSVAASARVRLVQLVVAQAQGVAELATHTPELEDLQRLGGNPARLARDLHSVIERVSDTATLVGEAFLRAELARDTLQALGLATEMFLELARRWPESLFAPKALLAASLIRPALADSIARTLVTRYPGSPYVMAMNGRHHEGYAMLEDSLLALAGTERVRVRAGPGRATSDVFTGPRRVPAVDDSTRQPFQPRRH